MKNLYSLCVIIAFVSFAGFLVENIWIGITKKYIDNRNMVFPFLFGYGLAVTSIYALFGTPHNISFFGCDIQLSDKISEPLLYFIIVFLCVSIGEIALGKTVEKVCHIKWWDYSKLPLHITQYTSFFTSLGFAVMIVLFMDKVFVPLHGMLMMCDIEALKNAAIILTAVMTADFLHSAYFMYKHKSLMQIWRIDLSGLTLSKRKSIIKNGK